MPGKAAKVIITERQLEVLESIIAGSTSQQRLVTRSQIILLAFEKRLNEEIAEHVGLGPDQVGTWRRRWRDAFERLVVIECAEGVKALRRAIEVLLSDEPRSGWSGKFTAEQVTQILAMACEDPQECGRPVTHWTPTELADEAVRRGIVESISPRQVGRFLKSRGIKTASLQVLVKRQSRRRRAVPV
jgi:putative transposase